MKSRTVQRFFPQSEAALIHQNGSVLTIPSKGVEIILHFRADEPVPCCAEVISGQHYAETGLSFDGTELVDFDGVFFLPRELGEMLNDAGFTVSEDCFSEVADSLGCHKAAGDQKGRH
jgi:hypothetical protein